MLREIYPISLQFALYFQELDIKQTFKIAQSISFEEYKNKIIEENVQPYINNTFIAPNTPIIKWETNKEKQVIFQIQRDRADFIINLNDSIKDLKQEFNSIFQNLDIVYKFVKTFCNPINRVGLVSTFVIKIGQDEQVYMDILKSNINSTIESINVNVNCKFNIFDSRLVYDHIRIFNDFYFSKLSENLRKTKLVYVQRDLNSGTATGFNIDENYLNKFKSTVLDLIKEDKILNLANGFIR